MILSQIRNQCVKLSGRYDLVKGDGSDDGMNNYIAAAVKLLDNWQETPESMTRYIRLITEGTLFISFTGCRAIKLVEVADSDGYRDELIPRDLSWIRGRFNSNSATGAPKFWAADWVRPCAEQLSLDTSDYYDVADLVGGNTYDYKGVAVAPAADKTYQLTVHGLFRSNALSVDADKNYWSEIYPLVLIKATLYQLEGMYRNTEGVNDFMRFLKVDLDGIDNSLVEQEIAGINQMENSL